MDSWCHLILSSSLKKNALGESNKYCLLLVISHSNTRVKRRYVSSKVSFLKGPRNGTNTKQKVSWRRMNIIPVSCGIVRNSDV